MYLKRKKGEKTIKKIKKKVWDLNPHPCALKQKALATTLSRHSYKNKKIKQNKFYTSIKHD